MSKNDYPMTVPDCSYIRVESFVLALLFCCFLFFFRLSFPNCISCVSTAMIFAFILTLLLIIGLRLRMLGISKAKLKPIVKPHLMSMKTTIVPLVRQLFIKKISVQAVTVALSVTKQLAPQTISLNIFVYTGVCVSVTVFYRVDGITEC